MSTVALKNVGTETFVDKFDGSVYKIKPGQTVLVPEGVAKHWLGDWTKTGTELHREKQRAAFRRGGVLPSLEIVPQEIEDETDDGVEPPSEEEEAFLKSIRKGASYVFPDGTKIGKKAEALAYLRETAAGN